MESKEMSPESRALPATFKQRLTLWRMTQKDFYEGKLQHEINRGEASDLITLIIKHFHGELYKLEIERRVRFHTGDDNWTIDQLRRMFGRGKRGKRPGENEQGPEPEQSEEQGQSEPEPDGNPEPTPAPQVEPEPEEAPKIEQGFPKFPGKLPEAPDTPEPKEMPDFGDMSLRDIQAWAEEIQRKQRELEQERERLKKELKDQAPQEYNPEGDDYIKPAIFDEVARYIQAGLNVHLAGPAGCGKTLMLRKVGEVLNRDTYIHSCSGGPERANLIESTELVSENGTQITKSILAAPLEHMAKDNSLTILDEIPALERECGMALNSLLEPSSRAVNTRAGLVKRAASNVIVSTGNTTGLAQDRKYMGSQLQDGSMKDRFITVRMDYDTVVEEKIAKMLLSEKDANRILVRLTSLRDKVTSFQIPFDPSTRRLVNACRAKKAGATLDRAFEVAFLNDLESHDRARVRA